MMLSRGSFLGRRTLVREVGPFRVTETRYDAGSRLPPHRHCTAYLCLVVRGSFVEHGRSELAARPGSVVAHPAGSHHADEFLARPGTCLNVEPDAAWLRRSLGAPALESGAVHWKCAESQRLVHAIAAELRAPEAVAALRLDGLLRELVAGVLRAGRGPDTTTPSVVEAAKALLLRGIPRPPRAREVAREVGVHASHLHRLFRRAEGVSIGEWLRRQRVEQCVHLLRSSRRSLVCIAAETGFADQSHMTRTLRRYVGCTPLQVRRAADPTVHA